MSDEIIWEDPPERAIRLSARGKYKDFAEALREHPGRWARLPGERLSASSAQGTAQNIRRGTMATFPKGEYEAVVDGTKVYVRFAEKAAAQPAEGDQDNGAGGQQAAEEATGADPDEGRWEARRVRLWASQNGFTTSDRGRLPKEVMEAYDAAHRGRGEQGVGVSV